MDLQATLLNIFYGLFKLSILVIFVTAIIQVIKGISTVGFFRMIYEIVRTMIKTKDKDGKPFLVSDETWKTLNFVIALIGLRLLNFTLLSSLLGIDIQKQISQNAAWFDYIATASICYMGTDWFYKRFGWAISQGLSFKKMINGELANSEENKQKS
jgi:hypothetical protein